MTPAERDEVRRRASDRLADHSMATVTSNERCACDRCDDDRAILRYVPPGEAASDGLATLDVSTCTYSDDDSGTDRRGVEIVPHGFDFEYEALSVADARLLAHAIHAAADAAKES